MKKQIILILPLLLISSVAFAKKKDIATVKNDSKGIINIYFRAVGCNNDVTSFPSRKRVTNVCYFKSVIRPNQSASYEWKWIQTGRYVSVVDQKGVLYSAKAEIVKQRREAGVPVIFPNDFHKE